MKGTIWVVFVCSVQLVTSLGPKFVAEPESRVVHSQKPNYPVNVIFPCSYHHVFPDVEMHVTWYRNGTVIQSGDAQYTIHPNGSLEISIREGIDATIEGLEYRCVVSNKFGSIISKPALIQYASFGDDWKEKSTTVVNITLRSLVLLPCNPPASNPPPVIEWYVNSVSIDTSDTNKYKMLPSGDLIIGNIDDMDNGTKYQCQVNNKLIFGRERSLMSYQLNVVERYTDDLTVYNTLSSSYMLKNGTDAEFTCMAHANDVKKLRYSFQLTDESLSFPGNVQEPNFDAKDIDHLTTLHINGVNKENEGQYNCTIGDVKNPMHPDVKNITKFNVSVFAPPVITSSPDELVNCSVGTSITLPCNSTAIPNPSLKFFVNTSQIQNNTENSISVINNTLILKNVSTANSGVYQCFAENEYGIASASWTIVVDHPDNEGSGEFSTVNSPTTASDVTPMPAINSTAASITTIINTSVAATTTSEVSTSLTNSTDISSSTIITSTNTVANKTSTSTPSTGTVQNLVKNSIVSSTIEVQTSSAVVSSSTITTKSSTVSATASSTPVAGDGASENPTTESSYSFVFPMIIVILIVVPVAYVLYQNREKISNLINGRKGRKVRYQLLPSSVGEALSRHND